MTKYREILRLKSLKQNLSGKTLRVQDKILNI